MPSRRAGAALRTRFPASPASGWDHLPMDQHAWTLAIIFCCIAALIVVGMWLGWRQNRKLELLRQRADSINQSGSGQAALGRFEATAAPRGGPRGTAKLGWGFLVAFPVHLERISHPRPRILAGCPCVGEHGLYVNRGVRAFFRRGCRDRRRCRVVPQTRRPTNPFPRFRSAAKLIMFGQQTIGARADGSERHSG